MNGIKLLIYNIIILLTSSKLLIQAEEKLNNTQICLNKTRSLKVLPGIKFLLIDDKVNIYVKFQDLLQETNVQSPRIFKNSLQKFGYMAMMTPFVLQILSLPGAIASVKMSLLKSIMVAQLAIVIMIYNLIKSAQNSNVIVVHRKKYQPHYHHHYSKYDEDEWFGRRR